MGELTIRRERGISGPRYQAAEKTEKTASAGETRPAAKTPEPPSQRPSGG